MMTLPLQKFTLLPTLHFCTMSQYELKVATRGNHAALLPVVLIVTSINEARPTPVVTVTYEDTALLQDGDKAIVQLTSGSNSVYGTANVIQELATQFPFLAGKDSKAVSCHRNPAIESSLFFLETKMSLTPRNRKPSGSPSWIS